MSSCTDVAEGDDVGVVFLGDVCHGNRLFMDIQSDVKRARLVHEHLRDRSCCDMMRRWLRASEPRFPRRSAYLSEVIMS